MQMGCISSNGKFYLHAVDSICPCYYTAFIQNCSCRWFYISQKLVAFAIQNRILHRNWSHLIIIYTNDCINKDLGVNTTVTIFHVLFILCIFFSVLSYFFWIFWATCYDTHTSSVHVRKTRWTKINTGQAWQYFNIFHFRSPWSH